MDRKQKEALVLAFSEKGKTYREITKDLHSSVFHVRLYHSGTVIEATVDGVKTKGLDSYRTQAGYFNVTNADNNIYDSPVGTYRAFAEGYFLFLEPLPGGNHDVNLKVSVLNPIEPSFNYNADWTYHLNIVPSNSTAAQAS
jgi:hypothetical protein